MKAIKQIRKFVRQLLQSQNSRQVLLTLMLYTLAIQLISLYLGCRMGQTSKYSKLFDLNSEQWEKKGRDQRAEIDSLKYLSERKGLKGQPQWPLKHSNGTTTTNMDTFCITIVTKVHSSRINYVRRSLAFLLSRLEPLKKSYHPHNLKVYLTNTHQPKSDHKVLSTLSTLVDIIHTEDLEKEQGLNFKATSTPIISHNTMIQRNNTISTILLLNHAAKIGCSHILILQDDQIVSKDFYLKIQQALGTLRDRKYFQLKLFLSDGLIGWSYDFGDFVLLSLYTSMSSALSMVVVFGGGLITCGRKAKLAYKSNNFRIVFLAIYTLMNFYYIVLFSAIGNQVLFPKFRKSDTGNGIVKLSERLMMMGEGRGGILGTVLPSEHFQGLSRYLRERVKEIDEGLKIPKWIDGDESLPSDYFVNGYAQRVSNLDTYLIVPNVIHYIGKYSDCVCDSSSWGVKCFVSGSFPEKDEGFNYKLN